MLVERQLLYGPELLFGSLNLIVFR